MFSGLSKNETKRLAALALLRKHDKARDTALGEFASLASDIMGVNSCFVTIFDDQYQYIKYVKNISQLPIKSAIPETMCQYAVTSAEPVFCSDTRTDSRFADHFLVTTGQAIFYAAAPLQTKDGFVLGTLCVSHTHPVTATSAQIENFLRIAALASTYLEAWYSLGRVDGLTGLPNRQSLLKEIETLVLDNNTQPWSLILFDCIDMPRAYELTRYLGLPAVEKMLRGFGPLLRLRLKLPSRMTLFAFAPGRYAVLVDAAIGQTLIQRAGCLPDIDAQIRGDIGIHLKVSTGYVNFIPQDNDPHEILRQGISALHEAMREQIPVLAFDPLLDQKRNNHFRLLHDLSEAIKAPDQLYMVYQPKISLHTGLTQGCEALLRWHHPVQGNVPPSTIVQLAEKTSLMTDITQWVIKTVIIQLQAWRKAGIDLPISINVTVSDFSRRGFADELEKSLMGAGLTVADLRIECLETEKVLESDEALYELGQLKKRGFKILLDDFGAGYSNISYLRRIPFDVIKLDRSLISQIVSDSDSRIIARNVISMLKDLNYLVLAEGIEDRQTAMMLKEYGCDEAQGYYFSRPISAAEIPAWLAKGSAVDKLPGLLRHGTY
ncbi:sensor domain-containing phosphodiesterase [Pseudescherichia vulneris]|uniref:sensor domain-containing diguanylate cyclase n=1 Tax=Pseudescherichia vulneris TaxID=566 RepID=UPI0028D28594|nr:sensor domain-containing phosphodiesterase [Pseudescherichia vulneris]